MVSYTQGGVPGTPDTNVGVGGVILIILIFLFIIVMAGLSIWMSLKRYELADTAMRSGDSALAVAALAPELGEGVASVIDSFRK